VLGNMSGHDAAVSAATYRTVFEGAPQPILIVQREFLRVLRANDAAARLYGYPAAELADIPLVTLWPEADDALLRIPGPQLQRHRHRDGREIETRVDARELALPANGVHALYVVDVSEERFSAPLLEAQVRLLDRVARGCPLAAVLDELLREVQALLPGVQVAVLVTEDDGSAERHGAVLRRDARSLPIRSSAGKALGTLAIDYQEGAAPQPHEPRVFDMALQLAAVAIEADGARRALIQSEARIWAFMDHSFALISIKDRHGRYVIVNRRFEQSTGIPACVARGRTDAHLFPRALAQAYSAHDEEVLRSLKGVEFEEEIRQRDGMHTYLAAKFPLVHPGGDAYGIGAILFDMTERKLGAHAVEGAREEERARISRELHDELGQMLTSLGMSHTLLARAIRERLPEADWVARDIDALHATVTGMLDAVRRIAMELRPEILERFGVEGAARWLVGEFSRRSGIRCRVALPQESFAIPAQHSLVIFRILQEALSNVAHHSGATEVEVALRLDGSHLELSIDDNGRGMPQDGTASLGLFGMHERAAAARGSVDVTRSPAGGTRITVRIPLE